MIGAIDPTANLMEGVDIPGSDLMRSNARHLGDCRIACVKLSACQAFTFVQRDSSCWLKSSGQGAMYRSGMISGYKHYEHVSPAQILPLE